jgi:hypothetical protein
LIQSIRSHPISLLSLSLKTVIDTRIVFSARNLYCTTIMRGHAVAQAVSRQLLTAAVRVQSQVRSCGMHGGQSGTGAGFLRVLQFPLPVLILCSSPRSSSSVIEDWYSRPNSGRHTKWTQSHPAPRNHNAWQVTMNVEHRPKPCFFI